MPLDGKHPLPAICDGQRLDNTVGSTGDYFEAARDSIRRLMVSTVHHRAGLTGEGCKYGSLFDFDQMGRTASGCAVVVADFGAQRARDVLDEGATEKDIQGLESIAGSQDRNLALERSLQQEEIGFIAQWLRWPALRKTFCPISCGIEIAVAPSKEESVQTVRHGSQRSRILKQRKDYRDAASGEDGVRVHTVQVLPVLAGIHPSRQANERCGCFHFYKLKG